ncbi:putative membrane protein [Paenibacillus aceris]|uniref:Membrane protein n=1 Tax=Paenibacillus aceris TaxID=869555 RepID=A0ABS4I8C3_9BACL|nr:putative membrane protein [Paenibacillus aceris]
MGYIVGGLLLLVVLVIIFMFVMFMNFGITPNDVKELYKLLRGRLSKFTTVIVVTVILILLFSLWIAVDTFTGKMQIQF